MPLTDAGRNHMVQAAIGAAVTAFNNANSYIGVGDSTAVFATTQTDLQGTTNRLRKAMDATYPSGATNVIAFRSTFATTDANWVWNEWGIFNNATTGSGTMLSRKVESLGTKTNTQTWQFTATLTFTTA
jgi:hypothetical protein